MDALSSSAGGVDLSKLSDREKQDLQQFVVNESQKARIQQCELGHGLEPPSRYDLLRRKDITEQRRTNQ